MKQALRETQTPRPPQSP